MFNDVLFFAVHILFWITSKASNLMPKEYTYEGLNECQATMYREGKHGNDDSEVCALMCLMYEDCRYFQWDPAYIQKPCWLISDCDILSHATCHLHKKKPNALSLSWKAGLIPPGLTKYQDTDCYGYNGGTMANMDEDVCHLSCLLNEKCLGFVYGTNRNCYSKTRCGKLSSLSNFVTYLKKRQAICISGHSCYAVFSDKDGVSRSEAQSTCAMIGGRLADFVSNNELNALSQKSKFSFWKQRLWIDLKMSGSQWKWVTSDATAVLDTKWADTEPTLSSEGIAVTVDPFTSWKFYTANPTTYKGYPLCELPHITQIWSSNIPYPIHILSDGNLETCYSPPTMMAAANIFLTTTRLNPDGEASTLVKVHGSNIVCNSSMFDNNVYIMNAVAVDVAGGKYKYKVCQVYAGYEWRGKWLCLYECNCPPAMPCEVVYLKMDLDPGISICEFTVL